MDAVVSGSAGLAILLEGARCWILKVDGSPKVEREPISLVGLFGDARDMQFLEGVDETFVRRELLEGRLGVQALHLVLMLCDAETSPRATSLAISGLDCILESGDAAERAERILYSSPVPKQLDLPLAVQRCRPTLRAGRFFDKLLARQAAIQQVRVAWNKLPRSLFEGAEDRSIADGTLAREGLYRQLVELIDGQGPTDAWLQRALHMPALRCLRGNEIWLAALLDSLRHGDARTSVPSAAAVGQVIAPPLRSSAGASGLPVPRPRSSVRRIMIMAVAAIALLAGVALAKVYVDRRRGPEPTLADAVAAPATSEPLGDRIVRPVPANADGVLTASRITVGLAASLRRSGTRVAVRYLPLTDADNARPLSATEVRAVLVGGLGLMAAQVPHAGGWSPSAERGDADGAKAAEAARNAELPRRVCLWLILEAPSGSADVIVRYANAWAGRVRDAGYEPGIALGPDTPLSSADLGSIRVSNYWQIALTTPQPTTGYQIAQVRKSVAYNSLSGYEVASKSDAARGTSAGVYAETIDVDRFTFKGAAQASPILAAWSRELLADGGGASAGIHSPVRGVEMARRDQGKVNWAAEATNGERFLMHACRDRKGNVDPGFAEDISGARTAGLVVGLYSAEAPLPPDREHPERTPADRAREDFDACHQSWRPGDLPPALLLEWPRPAEWAANGCTGAQIRLWTIDYLDAAKRLWGCTPMLRMSPDFAGALDSASDERLASYPLWISDSSDGYVGRTPPNGAMPVVPLPWTSWAMWHHAGAAAQGAFRMSNGAPVASDVVNNGDIGLDALRTSR